jgi:hypothetical protein
MHTLRFIRLSDVVLEVEPVSGKNKYNDTFGENGNEIALVPYFSEAIMITSSSILLEFLLFDLFVIFQVIASIYNR